jgi:hypothetical protein
MGEMLWRGFRQRGGARSDASDIVWAPLSAGGTRRMLKTGMDAVAICRLLDFVWVPPLWMQPYKGKGSQRYRDPGRPRVDE